MICYYESKYYIVMSLNKFCGFPHFHTRLSSVRVSSCNILPFWIKLCYAVCAKVKVYGKFCLLVLWRKKHFLNRQTCGRGSVTEKQKDQTREHIWPGVQRVSKPATTAVMPGRLPAAPRPNAAELCQTQPTLWGTATGGTPAWSEREGVRWQNQCVGESENQIKNIWKVIFCLQ